MQSMIKTQAKLNLNMSLIKEELGLTQRQIANAVRTGYLGLEVSKVNLSERSSVRRIYPDKFRKDASKIFELLIVQRMKRLYI